MTFAKLRLATAAGAALTLAACGGNSGRPAVAPAPPSVSAAAETDAAATLLEQGKEGEAKKRLKAVLKRQPMNAEAKLLLDSIERDPVELLGPDSYAYTVRAGDTIDGVAQRLLGNRLKAYQLARYNRLATPVALAAGQTLRIPGTPPRAEPVRRPEPARPAPTPTPVVKVKPAAAPTPAPAAAAANPAAARQARTAGLAALNQGNVARAVGLLRRAAALDPGNPAIARDLSRAERIRATVQARK